MTTKIIIFNAPPDSGKDWACAHLIKIFGNRINHIEFKKKVIDLLCCVYDLTLEEFYENYTRELKELPSDKFDGLSPRQALIKISEDVIKPNYGKEYFGLSVSRRLVENKINAASDGGFVEELNPIYDKLGAENILIVRIYRDGCTYEGDSRNYIEEYKDVQIIDLHNDGTLEEFEQKVLDIYKDFVE